MSRARSNHCSLWWPNIAERKVRGEPGGFRFRTGAEEEATEEEGEVLEGGNHLAVKGLGGGKGGR